MTGKGNPAWSEKAACEICGREITGETQMRRHLEAHERRGEVEGGSAPREEPVTDPGQSQLFEEEARPQVTPKFLDKLRRRREPATEKAVRTREATPRRAERRISAAPLLQGLCTMVGSWIEAKDAGVGRCLKLQAPAAGLIIDRRAKGTLVDRAILQPLARTEDGAIPLLMLVVGPMTVAMAERGAIAPETAANILREYLLRLGPDLVKAFAEVRKQEEQMAAALMELGPALGFPTGQVPDVDVILAWLLEMVGAVYEPEATIPEAEPAA